MGQRYKKTMQGWKHSHRDRGRRDGGLKSTVGQREMGLEGDQV